ncbi:hypothetical protein ABT215_22750 [Streptomyces sp900105755]|uniref:hypothetical protein n=1 Tax=Streptomyces sp. 900105755 TaxID=3154389 RepID=UPI00332C9A1D
MGDRDRARLDLLAVPPDDASCPHVQERLTHAGHLLDWPVRIPQDRFRLRLALTMHHLMGSR